MRILLVNPPQTKTLRGNNPQFLDDTRGCNPPLGIMYIASYLLYNTHHFVELWDCQVKGDVTNEIRFGSYDVIGITALTFTLLDVVDLIKLIKRVSPKSKIIVGGTHPTIYPNETLNLGADAVVQGEGEVIFPLITRSLNQLDKTINKMKQPIDDLDKLPFPLRTNIHKYNSIFSDGMATTLFTLRGCPYKCSFCYRPVMGRKVRTRSPNNVVNEIEQCVRLGIKDFLFYDDTFTLDRNRTLTICDEIIKRKLKIKFDVRTRVDIVDKELLKRLKQAGMFQIHLGIESGVQRILDRLNKGITLEQIEEAFRICRRLKIRTLGYIMVGNPDEKLEDIKQTEKFVRQVKPDYLHATIFTPFPATEIYRELVEKNDKDVWLEFAKNPVEGFVPPVWGDIPREELNDILMGIYKRFYLKPSYVIKKLLEFRNLKKNIQAGKRLLNVG